MKKFICAVISAFIIMSAFAVFSVNADTASGTLSETLSWEYDAETKILAVNGVGDMPDFPTTEDVPWKDFVCEIAQVIIEDGVTSVGNTAFYGCSALCKVTLPESIESIGLYAFELCTSLSYITLPEKLTEIAHYAFWLAGLETLAIPEGVNSVGRFSFQSCEKLKMLVLPSTLTLVDSFAFNNCTSLEKVIFRGSEEQWKNVEIGIFNSELDIVLCHGKEHLYQSTCDESCEICGFVRRAPHVYDDLYDKVCSLCGHEKNYTVGDVDASGTVDADDAIYLLYHTFFPEEYYIEQPCDFDKSGTTDADDAIYLLYHTFFEEEYPIVPEVRS